MKGTLWCVVYDVAVVEVDKFPIPPPGLVVLFYPVQSPPTYPNPLGTVDYNYLSSKNPKGNFKSLTSVEFPPKDITTSLQSSANFYSKFWVSRFYCF